MNFYIYLPILLSIVISCLLIRDINDRMSSSSIISFVFLFMVLPVLLITLLCFLSQKFTDFSTPITILTWALLMFQVFLTQITDLIFDIVTEEFD